MSAPKTLTRYGARAIVEGTYGAGGTPLSTDGILPIAFPDVELDYLNDGMRGPAPTGGQLPRAAQSGLGAAYEFSTHCYLPGVAYSATELPSVDKLLRGAGFAATLDVTPSSENVQYTPEEVPASWESFAWEVFTRGQQYDLIGAYNDISIASEGPEIPVWTAPVSAIGATPTDLVVPAITYPHLDTEQPAKSVNIQLALGAFTTSVVRSFSFELGRSLSPRANDNSAGGHAGFTPEMRDPRFTCVIEAVPLATFNPYTHRDLGTEIAVSFIHGSVQYSTWTVTFPRAQIVTVDDAEDGPTATWELEIAPAIDPGGAGEDIRFDFT